MTQPTSRKVGPMPDPCPHLSHSGIDQTPLNDPEKVWRCDECGCLVQFLECEGIRYTRPYVSADRDVVS